MFDPEHDRKSWARQQLQAAGVDEGVARGLMSCLQTWINLMPHDDQALRIFNDLVNGKAIEYHKREEVPEVWIEIRPGNIRRGEYVRVRLDAYSGDAGLAHNGRRGPVLRVSNGDVVVKYDDGLAPDYGIMGSHHSPYKLEKRLS